jgi:hypothetical protein
LNLQAVTQLPKATFVVYLTAFGWTVNDKCVMNMQLDIETGKTVAEWGFQKDGTDVAMKDLINDTKGVQGSHTAVMKPSIHFAVAE